MRLKQPSCVRFILLFALLLSGRRDGGWEGGIKQRAGGVTVCTFHKLELPSPITAGY